MTVTTIDLLRHGKPEGGEIFRGETDVAMSDEGLAQMQVAINGLSGWDMIVTSPLQRCSTFAAALAADKNIELYESQDLREISFGDWDGMPFERVKEEFPELFKGFWQNPLQNPPPNGEGLREFSARIVNAYDDLVADYAGRHMLWVVHGGVIRAIISEVLQTHESALMRYEVPYASLSRIKLYHEGGKVWPQLVFHNR